MRSAFIICALFIYLLLPLALGNMILQPRLGGWLLGVMWSLLISIYFRTFASERCIVCHWDCFASPAAEFSYAVI